MSKYLTATDHGPAQCALPSNQRFISGETGSSDAERKTLKRVGDNRLLSLRVFAILLFGLNLAPTQSASEIVRLPCSFSSDSSFEIEIDFEKSQMTLTTNFRQSYPIVSVTDNFVTAAGQPENTLEGKVIAPTDRDGGAILVIDRKIGEFNFAAVEGRCQESGCDPGSMRTYAYAGSCEIPEF